jgi:hypothetical protein
LEPAETGFSRLHQLSILMKPVSAGFSRFKPVSAGSQPVSNRLNIIIFFSIWYFPFIPTFFRFFCDRFPAGSQPVPSRFLKILIYHIFYNFEKKKKKIGSNLSENEMLIKLIILVVLYPVDKIEKTSETIIIFMEKI